MEAVTFIGLLGLVTLTYSRHNTWPTQPPPPINIIWPTTHPPTKLVWPIPHPPTKPPILVPVQPVIPVKPILPVKPVLPVRPIHPIVPGKPHKPPCFDCFGRRVGYGATYFDGCNWCKCTKRAGPVCTRKWCEYNACLSGHKKPMFPGNPKPAPMPGYPKPGPMPGHPKPGPLPHTEIHMSTKII